MTLRTIESHPLVEAKDKFSALTAKANTTGAPFPVLKGGKLWAIVSPVSSNRASERASVHIQPGRRTVAVADLDALFASYDDSFVPREDGFAFPVGSEEI